MEQHFHGKKQGKKKFPYELTIGMIVKNDVERLRTCLETMQILRDATSCQLIITDTGSSDGTRELAEEFADVFLDFTWCDDFSKARNTGVERAEGRWFVYFDSDHEFDESILSVVDFLKSKESYEKDCAFVTIRDYSGSMEQLGHRELQKPLFVNFGEKKRYFQERIHEYISVDVYAGAYLPVLVKHWGYVGELLQQKSNRNIPLLLKSIEEDPMGLKNYSQLVGEVSDQPEEMKKYILQGIDVAKKLIATGNAQGLEEAILFRFQLKLASISGDNQEKDLVEDIFREAEGKFSGTVLELEYLGMRVKTFQKEKKIEECVPYFRRFQSLHRALEKKPDQIYVNAGQLDCTDKNFYPVHECNLLVIALRLGKESLIEEFLPSLSGYGYQNHQGNHAYLNHYMTMAKQLKNGNLLQKIYNYIQIHGNGQERIEVQNFLGQCFLEFTQKSYQVLLESFSNEPADLLLAPYIYEARNCQMKDCPKVEPFFSDNSQLFTSHYKILLIDYLRTGKDTFGYIKKAPFSVLLKQFDLYWKQYDHPQQLMYQVFSTGTLSSGTWKEKKLCGYLGLRALNHLCEQGARDVEDLTVLYQGASQVLYEYVCGMYQEGVLETQEIDVIPPVELFAYHSHKAWTVQGDDVAFVTSMKAAILAYGEYKKIITFFLDVMREKRQQEIVLKQEARKQIQPATLPQEQSDLSLKVKKTLGQLILAGKKEEAMMILEKYEKISPNDPDLPLLQRTCEAICT